MINLTRAASIEISDSQNITITNYTIGNITSLPNDFIKLESVARACGHSEQIPTLWVYVYQNGTKILEDKQECKPITSGSHHISVLDIV